MLTYAQALEHCMAAVRPLPTERVPLCEAYGRVLAAPVVAEHPVPHWDNSAMDGFAVHAGDFTEGPGASCDAPARTDVPPVSLRVLETIAAGAVGTQTVVPGTCARIMTGAPMPQGATAVVMREQSAPDGPDRVILTDHVRAGQHVRRAGEEIRPGQTLLSAGHVLTPPSVGLCASQGLTHLPCTQRPKVAIISTGDEVVPPGTPLGPGQIWSSNTHALVGMVREAGGEAIDCGIAPDTLVGTRASFQKALDAGADFILSTGGVSVGDFDVVREALSDVGAEMQFWKVRIKPGKPLAFGRIGGVAAFGLPGNPVSCMVEFLQFVRPVLRACLGDPTPFLPVVQAVLDASLKKRPGARAELVRVALRSEGGRLVAAPAGPQGSHRTSSMAGAHGLALLSVAAHGAHAGDTVPVQIFDPRFQHTPTCEVVWGGREAPDPQ